MVARCKLLVARVYEASARLRYILRKRSNCIGRLDETQPPGTAHRGAAYGGKRPSAGRSGASAKAVHDPYVYEKHPPEMGLPVFDSGGRKGVEAEIRIAASVEPPSRSGA